MSDLPKVHAVRPHELREQAMKWLAEIDDHLASEEPDNKGESNVEDQKGRGPAPVERTESPTAEAHP